MSKKTEAFEEPPAYTAVAGQPTYPTQQPAYQGGYGGQPGYAPQYNQSGYAPQYNQPGYYGGAQQQVVMQPQTVHLVPVITNPPETHMLFSVLATLCCCWPIGIFAIMRSMEVSNAISRGDRESAERHSARAYQLAKWAVIAGVVFTAVTLVIVIVFYAVLFSSTNFYDD